MNIRHYPLDGFSDRLYEVYEKSGLSISEVSKRSGIARSSVHGYLYYDQSPTIAALARLCKVFNVTADYLLFGKR